MVEPLKLFISTPFTKSGDIKKHLINSRQVELYDGNDCLYAIIFNISFDINNEVNDGILFVNKLEKINYRVINDVTYSDDKKRTNYEFKIFNDNGNIKIEEV